MLTSTIAFIISGNPEAKAEGGFDGSWITIRTCPGHNSSVGISRPFQIMRMIMESVGGESIRRR